MRIVFFPVVLLLVVVLVLQLPAGTVQGFEVRYGDVNNDHRVNVVDAVLILRHTVGLIDIEEIYGTRGLRSAKVTPGGREPDVTDAIAILQYIVGAINRLPRISTAITGQPEATVCQAQQWARNRGAHQRFINIAPVYWEYGEITGIRPEVLYAQSAKETNFGKYTGQVKPAQNNWAGIKTRDATGDRPEDHDTFASPRDGVRAHFNHMSAYVGLSPVGIPHDRYHLVMTIDWAGSIRDIRQLGGRWAPDPGYGISIIDHYLFSLLFTDPS